jgi:hypothetical protein
MIVSRCKELCLKFKNKTCEGATFGGLYVFACWDFEGEDDFMTESYLDLIKEVF